MTTAPAPPSRTQKVFARIRGAVIVWRRLYEFQTLRGWRRIYWTFVNWNRMGRGRDFKS